MSAELYTCPRCATAGFQLQGLKAHVCRGAKPGEQRRRLTLAEITKAYASGTAVKVAMPRRPVDDVKVYRARRVRR